MSIKVDSVPCEVDIKKGIQVEIASDTQGTPISRFYFGEAKRGIDSTSGKFHAVNLGAESIIVKPIIDCSTPGVTATFNPEYVELVPGASQLVDFDIAYEVTVPEGRLEFSIDLEEFVPVP